MPTVRGGGADAVVGWNEGAVVGESPAIAAALAAHGAEVDARQPRRCKTLALPGDATDTEVIHRAVADTPLRSGVSGRPFLAQSERSWRGHIDINLTSMLTARTPARQS
ncbi:MAG: hypothetical protein Q8R44_14635 [Novosphingobium sp.]|nr:hypothetical protein [Novosphingobium sp.]